MVRGKRLREKQRALIMRQKPRRGRRFGSVVRRKKNITIDELRRAVFRLMESGHSAEAACYAARKKFGAQFTPEGLRRFRIQMYRQSLTGNSNPA